MSRRPLLRRAKILSLLSLSRINVSCGCTTHENETPAVLLHSVFSKINWGCEAPTNVLVNCTLGITTLLSDCWTCTPRTATCARTRFLPNFIATIGIMRTNKNYLPTKLYRQFLSESDLNILAPNKNGVDWIVYSCNLTPREKLRNYEIIMRHTEK